MPGLGGLNPFPCKLGGGKSRAAVILQSLNAQRGTAYDTAEDSPIYLENLVIARVIAGMWATAQRLANGAHARFMTGAMLARWEKIYGLRPKPTDLEPERRARIAAKRARIGQPITHGYLVSLLEAAIPEYFVAIEYTDISLASITVPIYDPTSGDPYPFGTESAEAPWSSTVARVLVRLQKPDGATEGQFYAAAGTAIDTLLPLLSAWCTVDWYRASLSTPIDVPGGPSAAGIYLDDEHNLDNNVFDV